MEGAGIPKWLGKAKGPNTDPTTTTTNLNGEK